MNAYIQNDPQIMWDPYTQRYVRVQPQIQSQTANTAWGGNTPPAPPVPQPVQTGLPTIHRVVWVQGMEAAKSVQLSPNEHVMAIDSESDRFYIASAGPDGRPKPLEAFSYAREEAAPAGGDYVTRKEFDELKASIASLRGGEPEETEDE